MASSTSTAQRIGIIIIATVMAVGTIGSFFIMILANENNHIDARERTEKQEKASKLMAEYQKKFEEYQRQVEAEATGLSPKYYEEVASYKNQAQPFDGSKVKELGKKDLKEGTGAEVKSPSDMRAYYIGWNEKGKIFDSSLKDGGTLAPPFDPSSAIVGWQKGVVGMKIGGVRELTIPSELAYGNQKKSDDIPANAPLKFILVAVEKSSLTAPEIPKELADLYGAH